MNTAENVYPDTPSTTFSIHDFVKDWSLYIGPLLADGGWYSKTED